MPEAERSNNRKKRRNCKILIGLISLIVIAGIVTVLLLVLTKKDNPDGPKPNPPGPGPGPTPPTPPVAYYIDEGSILVDDASIFGVLRT